jgi:hypothetical protein
MSTPGPPPRVDTDSITAERLAGWRKRLAEQHSTPLVLVGIGHEERSGQVVVLAPNDAKISDEIILNALRFAVRILENG